MQPQSLHPSAPRAERGQSMVELALSFTLLLMFLAGVIDLGRALFAYMAIRDASQEGAAYGSINPTNLALIQQRVRGSSDFPVNLNDANVTITVSVTGSSCAGGAIAVSVVYNNFPLVFPFSNILFGQNGLTLGASTTDTILMPQCP